MRQDHGSLSSHQTTTDSTCPGTHECHHPPLVSRRSHHTSRARVSSQTITSSHVSILISLVKSRFFINKTDRNPRPPSGRTARPALKSDQDRKASSSSKPKRTPPGTFYGHVRFWDATRAFGFIRADDVHTKTLDFQDVYVHIRDTRYLSVGSRVRFRVDLGVDGRLAARHVETVLDDLGR